MTPDEAARREKVRAKYRLLGKLFVWSGWGVFLLSAWLSSRIIDALHARVAALEKELQSFRAGR